MLKIAHIGKLHTNTYRVELHNHDLWEAVYYTKGKGKLQVGEETVSFQAGDIFILPPGLIHSDYSDGGFQDIFFTFYRTNLPANHYHRFRDLDTQAILHLLNQMHDAFMRNDPNREAIINLLYELIFQYMYTWDSSPKMNTYVESIRNAVIAGFSDPYFSITDVIKKLHLNANYARSLFVKWTGSTPAHFLLEKRMEYAKQLLFSRHLSNYSFQQISFMCGFSDPYYFSRMFRKYTGLSPREWEKQLPHSSNP
ncbi:MAG: AraC family transcriptional regulator [Clostridia bacterium]|nr:AraC family transcriptional regulator [Clostridia bacterium]